MEHFDVIIVGAGPAGGQCARDLAHAGKHVLLIEKSKTFDANNYSSGGSNLAVMHDFNLPENLIATYWNKFTINMTDVSNQWVSPQPGGVILDFKKLRQFLADETLKNGSVFRLGLSYHHHDEVDGKAVVYLKNHETKETETYITDVIVDATGSDRKVLAHDHYDKSSAMCSTGIEFLLQVQPEDYNRYANTLTSYMGPKWMPQGYAWIFPMEQNRLKIGVIRYFQQDNVVPHEQSYLFYLEQLIKYALIYPHQVLDKHGKTLYYTYLRKDEHYKGNIIAVGDAVSTLNPLAAEGIRHALYSGQQATSAVLNYLKGNKAAFQEYEQAMNRYCGWKWTFSEMVMNQVFKTKEDRRFDLYLEILKTFDFQELMDLLFDYKTSKFLKFAGRYGIKRIFR